ncbi:hypothetical protein BCR33DRAFT_715106 [Rhizoclosmatium globosum]|uniref:TPR-like protein n=1 Tax=Rhizoclosmatium globosum TaxID=329046 RepID=A0A1Y2CK28_9FUNG|nr:hypothetical protein BCR33DRAFT_715106 [Rhizoclosmatium globosum]|eukprot:ORY47378.1 hypothetical protein BCR33DRAFT_715106 [Rhizoclosmatium globosum]
MNRLPKKAAKKKEQSEPQTFDEFMEYAVEQEERGERYKDGDKARRSYELAVQAYAQAASYKRDAFVIYNKGRLLLLLAEFKNPQYNLTQQRALLEDSVVTLREAIALDPEHPDSMFNLAQAIKALFERVLDNGDTVTQNHLERLSEADNLLERALVLQLAELEKSKALAAQAAFENSSCAPGCGHDHDHSGHSHAHEESMEEVSEETGGDEEGFEVVNQQEPVTNATIIETLVEHSSLLTLAASALYSISVQQAEVLYAKSDAKLAAARPYWDDGVVNNEPSDIGLARATLYVTRGESLFEASPKTEETSAEWKSLFESAAALYDDILVRHPACAEAPADKGDLLCTWAESVMTVTIGCPGVPGFEALINNVIAEQQQLLQQQQGSSSSSSSSSSSAPQPTPALTFLTQLRQIYAQASKSYIQAQTLDPAKGSVSHRLGDLEATRTSLYPPSLDPSCTTAYTNTQQILLKNAATHYKRALDALGVPVNLLSTQRSCADEDAARGALFGMAKVLSHMDGREEDVRVALICWKRRSGVLGEDGEGCGIVFSERVLGLEWFEKVCN